MSMNIIPTAAVLGAEIAGVDLSRPLDDAMFAAIERAYNEYGVIFFRSQSITPAQQVAFTRRFGGIEFTARHHAPAHQLDALSERSNSPSLGTSWPKPVSSITMKSTFGAPSRACGEAGQAGCDSLTARHGPAQSKGMCLLELVVQCHL